MKPTRKPVNAIRKLRSGTPLVIGALGDSLTYGWMVDRGYGSMIWSRPSGYIRFLRDTGLWQRPSCNYPRDVLGIALIELLR